MHAGNHTICTVHEKWDSAVVNLHPFQGLKVLKKASQRQKYTALFSFVEQLNDQRNAINKHHGPRPVFSHLQKSAVHIQIDVEVMLQRFEERGDVFASNWAPFSDAPIGRHAHFM